jgi:GNAT superfamily N-acetyltransferase
MPRRATIDMRPAADLDGTCLDEMWALYGPHHAVTRDELVRRCRDDVDEIALYRAHDGALVGFTGIRRRRLTLRSGEEVATAYFGTSFIDEAWRGRNLIQRTVLRVLYEAKRASPRRRLFVWSDALTVRPYLLTARNLREYYPSPLQPMPADVQELRDTLGVLYYGDDYEPTTGTVRKRERKLEAQLLEIDPRQRDDVHVRFYLEQNPRYVDGHGLLIIQPATVRNALAYAGIRVRRLLSAPARRSRAPTTVREALADAWARVRSPRPARR